jgi:hypothetical protein
LRIVPITGSDFTPPRSQGNLRAQAFQENAMITTVQADPIRRLFCITALIVGAAADSTRGLQATPPQT